MRASPVSVLFALLFTACSPGEPPDPGGGAADMQEQNPPPGMDACDPRSPRPEVPEVFVGPTELERRLIGHIDGARRSIDLLMYELTQQSLIDRFIAAHKRGIAVRVLLDGKRGPDYEGPKGQLQAAGVEVRAAPARFQYAHAKVMIVDRSYAVVMSANMDSFSMDRARNYGVVDRDRDDLKGLQAVFDADWAGANPDLSCTRLIVSPENSQKRLQGLLASARQRIDLEVMYLSERDLVATVKERIKAGVRVRILLATPRFIMGNEEDAKDFLAAGAQVQYFYNLHAKLVIADGVAFIGSENLSFTSLTRNREVGIFVTEPAAAAVATGQFETDWKSGVPVQ
jgi:phosphatidylserine/phosphatidylglycerophosphate/cardiolipin synthase-like enzyme